MADNEQKLTKRLKKYVRQGKVHNISIESSSIKPTKVTCDIYLPGSVHITLEIRACNYPRILSVLCQIIKTLHKPFKGE